MLEDEFDQARGDGRLQLALFFEHLRTRHHQASARA
jgi:hypothetical protein